MPGVFIAAASALAGQCLGLLAGATGPVAAYAVTKRVKRVFDVAHRSVAGIAGVAGITPVGGLLAQRISLTDFCEQADCPADWETALARAQVGYDDAGIPGAVYFGCYVEVTGCGVDTLVWSSGTPGVQWNFDHATGELIGAASVFTDVVSGPCDFNEVHAGRDRPKCSTEEGLRRAGPANTEPLP